MLNKFHHLVIVTVSVSLGLAVVKAEPARAALFQFNFGSGFGELSFTNSNLKGIGIEQASLSELHSLNEDNADSYFYTFPYYIFPPFSSFQTNHPEYYGFDLALGNPVFTFESGELKGIEYSESRNFEDEFIDINSAPPGGYSSSQGGIALSLLGDRYEASISGAAYFLSSDGYPEYIYNEFGEVIDVIYHYELVVQEFNESDEGTISFFTIEPVEAIPEPLTLLGTGTAIGFGTFFKRQLARKSKKIK